MADEKGMVQIPYFTHEADMERLERANKRSFVLILILIVALVGSNLAWIIYENQFVDEVTTITQSGEADGNGTILLNNDGEINYGEGNTDSNN